MNKSYGKKDEQEQQKNLDHELTPGKIVFMYNFFHFYLVVCLFIHLQALVWESDFQ